MIWPSSQPMLVADTERGVRKLSVVVFGPDQKSKEVWELGPTARVASRPAGVNASTLQLSPTAASQHSSEGRIPFVGIIVALFPHGFTTEHYVHELAAAAKASPSYFFRLPGQLFVTLQAARPLLPTTLCRVFHTPSSPQSRSSRLRCCVCLHTSRNLRPSRPLLGWFGFCFAAVCGAFCFVSFFFFWFFCFLLL